MSHFTTIRTQIRNQDNLIDTLKQLHHTFQVGERLPIRGYQGGREIGQVVIDTGSTYDIGFQRQPDQTFTVCADWWGVQRNSPLREVEFLRSVNQNYSLNTVRQQVLKDGLLIEQERVLENGEIELVVCERI